MRIFVEYIKNYFKEEFNWTTHAIILTFLGVCIFLNYGLVLGEEKSLYDELIHIETRSFTTMGLLILFFSLPFFFTLGILRIVEGKKLITNGKYILFALIGIILLSLDYSYYLMNYVDDWFGHNQFIHAWVHDCASNLSSFLTIVIPLFILYFFIKKFHPERFGFKLNGARLGPYLWLIVLMIPLLIIASFNKGFIDHYPMYTERFAYEHMNLEQWHTEAIFELCYGSRFISVEMFFRGFLVVGLSKYVGKDAILPMVAIYCFLHFGKPAGEAVSSIFGGYILGILAYESRNIYGGLIAHLGIAWGMEYVVQFNPFI